MIEKLSNREWMGGKNRDKELEKWGKKEAGKENIKIGKQ